MDIVRTIIDDVKKVRSRLAKILRQRGEAYESLRLSHLLDAVERMKAMKVDHKYIGVTLDKNGYVVRAFKIDDFAEYKELPNDLTNGYYKIDGDQFVIDEERKRQVEDI